MKAWQDRFVSSILVRTQMVRAANDWPWSNYRVMIGETQTPEWLDTRTILTTPGEAESETVERYIQFVAEGKDQPSLWEQMKNQVFLCSDAFVESWNPCDDRYRGIATYEKYYRPSDDLLPRTE